MAMRMKPTAVKAQAAPAVRAVKAAVPAAKWAPAGLLAAATLAQAAPAKAVETEIDSSVEAVIGAVKSAGELVKSGITTVDSGIKLLQQGYEAASPVFDQGVKAVSPIVQQAAKATAEAASPALSAALPAFSDAQKAVEATLKDSSISSVVDTTKGAITVATPIAAQIAKFLTTTEPVLLAEYGAGALAFFYLAPALLGGLGSAFKGYAGEITAAQVLDALTDGNSALVDIRTQKEKESSGVPDVPSSLSNRLVEVEFAVTEDKKLRNALRDPNSIEAAVTSMQIASLKRVNKGTKIILLDRYGNASTVAKELASKGFGKVYTVQGGFDGRNGWVQSKLQIKPAASVINAPLPFLGTRGATGTKKALPAPKA